MVRTDGDTWDPASGVGMTATFGAVARAVGTNKGLINDPFSEPLVRAAGVEYFIRVMEDQQYAADGGGDPVMEGMLNILAVHGRFLDEYLTRAARAGIRQAVNLGCGLDTRAYRLWWPLGTTLYECDQPGVMDFKAQVLRDVGGKLTAHRCAVGVDLRGDWLTALRRVGFDPAQPTVWIAENLLVGYLPPDAQDRLLHQVSASSAAGSRFAADHMPWTEVQLQEGRAFIEGWRQEGLDIDLGKLTYSAEFGSLPENLEAHGWRVTDRTLVELLATVGLSGRRRLSPHDLAVTPRYVTATMGGR
jgi:methyltransferase (TIGR00027 family)